MRAAGERRVAGRERKDDRCHREVGKPSNARPSVSPRHGLELLGRRPSHTRLRIRSPLTIFSSIPLGDGDCRPAAESVVVAVARQEHHRQVPVQVVGREADGQSAGTGANSHADCSTSIWQLFALVHPAALMAGLIRSSLVCASFITSPWRFPTFSGMKTATPQ